MIKLGLCKPLQRIRDNSKVTCKVANYKYTAQPYWLSDCAKDKLTTVSDE